MRETAPSDQLLEWYDTHAREMPWRVGPAARRAGVVPDPYRVWMSEIMLQQTTVAAVKEYFVKFTRTWPTVQDLAAAQDADVMAAWVKVYQDPAAYWHLYELAEKLVDLEDYFRRWRFNHVTTVERIIGFKRGTGGTSGVAYLRKMLEVELFPELWHLRGVL